MAFTHLATLPPRVFEDLHNLTDLKLNTNYHLTELVPDTFAGLDRVVNINLALVPLTTLHAGSFRGLSSLPVLNLMQEGDSGLVLPGDVFDGLHKLTTLHLGAVETLA